MGPSLVEQSHADQQRAMRCDRRSLAMSVPVALHSMAAPVSHHSVELSVHSPDQAVQSADAVPVAAVHLHSAVHQLQAVHRVVCQPRDQLHFAVDQGAGAVRLTHLLALHPVHSVVAAMRVVQRGSVSVAHSFHQHRTRDQLAASLVPVPSPDSHHRWRVHA